MSRLILIAATLLIGFAIGLGTGWFWWKSATNPQEVKSPLAFKNTARDGRAPKQSNPPLNLQKHGQEKKEGDPKELTGTASSANDKLPVPAKTAKDIIDQILSEIESSGSEKADGQKIWKRLQKLRKFGEEGSQAILEFLRTNKDISSGPNGWGNFLHEGLSAERYVQFHSLREGLLEVLYEMKSPTAQTASLEALQTTSSAKEVLLAIRNLEKVIAIDPKYSTAYLLLGKALEAEGNLKHAESIYQTGIVVASKKGDMMPANEMQSRLNQIVMGPSFN